MASTISAGTTAGTAIVVSGDTSGSLVLQTNGTTTAVTISTGQVVTLAQPLPVASGGSGVTTSTGSGANVLGTSPTLITPNIGAASATGLSMYGLITGQASTATDVNTANDAGALSCRSDGTATTVASMSFHRPGAYAINMGLGADNVFRIGGWSASNNCFQLDGSGNATILGNLLFNSGYGSAATAYGCRAWVNFNGTGTVAIRGSGNVSSITDNGTGDYTVNFTTALADTNYAAVSMAGQYGGGINATLGFNLDFNTRTTTAYRIYVVQPNSPTSTSDIANATMAFFR